MWQAYYIRIPWRSVKYSDIYEVCYTLSDRPSVATSHPPFVVCVCVCVCFSFSDVFYCVTATKFYWLFLDNSILLLSQTHRTFKVPGTISIAIIYKANFTVSMCAVRLPPFIFAVSVLLNVLVLCCIFCLACLHSVSGWL